MVHDHRGVGRSSRDPIRYSIEQMTGDVLALMDHLGIEQAALIGQSTGGAIGQGMPCAVGAAIACPDRRVVSFQADLAARRPFRNMRLQQPDVEGQIHYLNVHGTPVYDAAGAFRGYRGTAQDITQQVAAEAEIRRARLEAESANRLKDEFLATLSHELRTPLNAILGWTSMLTRGQVDASRLPSVFQVLDRNAQSQAQLIAYVLDVSRIITGKLLLRPGIVDLCDIVARASDAVRPAAVAKNIRLVFDESRGSMVRGDGDFHK